MPCWCSFVLATEFNVVFKLGTIRRKWTMDATSPNTRVSSERDAEVLCLCRVWVSAEAVFVSCLFGFLLKRCFLDRCRWRASRGSWSAPSVKSSSHSRWSCPASTVCATAASESCSCPTTTIPWAPTPDPRAPTPAALAPESRPPAWRSWTAWCDQVTLRTEPEDLRHQLTLLYITLIEASSVPEECNDHMWPKPAIRDGFLIYASYESWMNKLSLMYGFVMIGQYLAEMQLFKGTVHPKMNTVIIYSSSSRSKPVWMCLFWTQRKIFWRKFVIRLFWDTIDFNSRRKILLCFPHSSEYLPLCSEQTHSYRFGSTWGWVNDRIFIFGCTVPLNIWNLRDS